MSTTNVFVSVERTGSDRSFGFHFGYRRDGGRRCNTAVPAWLLAVMLTGAAAPAAAQTEFQFQYGNLVNPFSAESTPSRILTFQQASGWSLGDSFFFIDYIDDDLGDGFNDKDFYGEWYPTLSFGKMSGRTVGGGVLRDVALIGGINFGGDADFFKYLPGVRLSWAVPGFFFLNTDFTAFIDGNTGSAAPRTSNSWMFDVNWGAGFDVGTQSFAFFGHAEYIHRVTDEFGNEVRSWILAQPQFVWDFGKAISGQANQLFLGGEYQYWPNKLGTDTDENLLQLLIIWRL